jgi:adenylate kinase
MPFSGSNFVRIKVAVPLPSVLSEVTTPAVYRSLNCEHIARAEHAQHVPNGVPRNILPPSASGKSLIPAMRRWFFQRKPDAGFVLLGFPDNLRDAAVLDDWLETRGETLDVCLFPAGALSAPAADLFRHYRALSSAEVVGASEVLREIPLPNFVP